jgi:hypothetical protein
MLSISMHAMLGSTDDLYDDANSDDDYIDRVDHNDHDDTDSDLMSRVTLYE